MFGGQSAGVVTEIVAHESVTVPYGRFSEAVKILVTSTGALEDVPMYFWFAGDFPGPVKAQEVDSGDAIVLIGYEGDAFAFTGDLEEDLLSITAVHPMREDAVEAFLARAGVKRKVLRRLVAEGQLVEAEYGGARFYLRRLG